MRGRVILLSLLAFLSGTKSLGQDVAARILSVQGTVEVQEGTPGWAPAQVDQTLRAGAVVRTAARSRAALLLADETQLKIGPNARLQLREVRQTSNLLRRVSQVAAGADQSILNLESGKAWLRSKRVPAKVRVRTPAVTAAIRGTEFVVDVRTDGESFVTVLDGSVDVNNDQGAVIVNSGEQGRARIGEAPIKIVIVNPDDAVQWTFSYSPEISPRDYPFRYRTRAEARQASQAAGISATARAEALHDAGDLEGALTALQADTSPRAAEMRGWILLQQNRLAEGFQAFQEAGSGSRARLGRSMVHLRMNEFDQAYELVAEPGADTVLQLHRARLDLLAGEVDSARDLLEAIGPTGAEYGLAQGLLANLNLVANRKEEALQVAGNAVSHNPESPSAHLNLSLVQQSFFDLPAATRSARQALELDPGFVPAPALVQYSRLLYGAGDSVRAEKIVQQALALAPEQASVHSALGFVLLGQAETDAAVVEFERAVQINSGLADPHLGLGIALMRRGQFTEAVAEILVATTLEPRLSIYHSYLGKAFYEERKFEQAFSALDAAVELDPRDPTPHLYSGIFQNDLNRPGAAVNHFQDSIRLNDNRAVYRSRFVLDEDRATRNVQLATAYNRLGLSEWANLEAVLSNLDDPTNSSAHLFLANTFLNLPGRTGAAGSELLVAKLLQPVNANSFNAFNDYTTLYDRPHMNWTTQGAYGSFDSPLGRLVASGGTSRFAYGSVFQFDRTSGFRDGNDGQKAYTTANNFKFALTPHSDLLVSYAHQQQRLGDVGQLLIRDEKPDPDESTFTRTNRLEAGYHHRLRPGSDVMFYFAARTSEIVSDDLDAVLSPSLFRQCRFAGKPPPCGFLDRRTSSNTPNLTFQAAHYLKVDDFDFKYGVDFFQGRRNDKLWIYYREDEVFPVEDPELIVQDPIVDRQDLSYRTLFFQTNYRARSDLVLTGGLNYEWANDDNVFIGENDVVGVDDGLNPVFGTNESDWLVNPQFGVLYNPVRSSTLRAAVMRSRQPLVSGGSAGAFTRERLLPVHINGFLSTLNEVELSRSWGYNLGWDQRIGRKSFIRATAFRRDREIPHAGTNPLGMPQPQLMEGDLYGAGVVWNQFVNHQVTFVTAYNFTQNEDLFSFRKNHEGSVSLYYVSPRGFFFTASENFFKQNGILGVPLPETEVFTTDVRVAYEFPEKLGLVSFRVSNLFDRRYQFLVDPLALNQRIPRRQFEVALRFYF